MRKDTIVTNRPLNDLEVISPTDISLLDSGERFQSLLLPVKLASMGTMKLLFPFFIFLFSTIQLVTSQNMLTTNSRCSDRVPTVQFPFSLEGDEHERRGSFQEMFHLSCDEMNRTVIQIEAWGNFLVRNINYDTQEVQIYDQDNCLLKRLLDISSSSATIYFRSIELFSLFNCSSELSSSQPMRCLSTADHTVHPKEINTRCRLWRSVVVPWPWQFYELRYDPYGDSDYIYLRRIAIKCGESCVEQGGQCRIKNTQSLEITCVNLPPRRGVSTTLKYVIGLGVGIPILTMVILIACYICGRFKSESRINNINHRRHVELSFSALSTPTVYTVGLDEAVIQSYPTTVLGELGTPEDNNCSICLSEYRPKQIIRTIPECKHCFHAACIDEWLRRNVTCPLCRNSTLPENPPV